MSHAKLLKNEFQKENRFEVILKINRYKRTTKCFWKLKIRNPNEKNIRSLLTAFWCCRSLLWSFWTRDQYVKSKTVKKVYVDYKSYFPDLISTIFMSELEWKNCQGFMVKNISVRQFSRTLNLYLRDTFLNIFYELRRQVFEHCILGNNFIFSRVGLILSRPHLHTIITMVRLVQTWIIACQNLRIFERRRNFY